MIDWNRFGPLLAVTLAGAAVAGAILIISLDFASAEGAGDPLTDRLREVAAIDLFVEVAVPGSDAQVHTGTEYASPAALAEGRPTHRWCYIDQGKVRSAYAPQILLGRQQGDEAPVYTPTVTPEEARSVGVSVDQLDAIAHRDCRLGGKGERS